MRAYHARFDAQLPDQRSGEQLSAALALAGRVGNLDGEDPVSEFFRGCLYTHVGESRVEAGDETAATILRLAAASLSRAAQQDPRSAEAHYRLARAQFALSEAYLKISADPLEPLRQAEFHCGRALQLDGSSKPSKLLQAQIAAFKSVLESQ
jgi:hypothetical protein